MWQRWNSGSKIFEKSSDNGASWTPLGLDASILTQGQVAPALLQTFLNTSNTFTPLQYMPGGIRLCATGIGNPIIWGTGSVASGRIHYAANDHVFMDENSANLVYLDPGGNIQSRGLLYPGDMTGTYTPLQSNWYIASHASYGLFANTGFNIGGRVWCDRLTLVNGDSSITYFNADPSYGGALRLAGLNGGGDTFFLGESPSGATLATWNMWVGSPGYHVNQVGNLIATGLVAAGANVPFRLDGAGNAGAIGTSVGSFYINVLGTTRRVPYY